MAQRLPRSFFQRDAVSVARALLGQRLVRVLDGQRLAGIIVETEAYLGVMDQAAHTFGGRRTPRNEAMWGEGGHAYVYFTYGMHHCLNVVASRAGDPVAVLLRALEPEQGMDTMRRLRSHRGDKRRLARATTQLCSGPAKLCEALNVDRALDGADLVEGDALFIERARGRTLASTRIVASPRIGIAYTGEWAPKPLRFTVRDNKHVSKRA